MLKSGKIKSGYFSQEGDNFDNVAKTNVEKWQRKLGSSRKKVTPAANNARHSEFTVYLLSWATTFCWTALLLSLPEPLFYKKIIGSLGQGVTTFVGPELRADSQFSSGSAVQWSRGDAGIELRLPLNIT